MDPHIRDDVLRRLKRIEGQVRGVSRMLSEARECTEILQQIASIKEALNGAAKTILEGHIRYCTRRVQRARSEEEERRVLESLLRSIQVFK